jgi:hypothetical protein
MIGKVKGLIIVRKLKSFRKSQKRTGIILMISSFGWQRVDMG